MKKIISILLLLFFWNGSKAQTDNYGTEFWTGFMSNYTGTLKLYISAKQNSSVTIDIPLQSYKQTITVLKDSVVDVTLPNAVAEITGSETVEKTGIHITSDFPVSVSAMNLRTATTDATVVLPLKNIPLNSKYVTGHPSKTYKTFSFGSTNEFLLVSPENGLQVEITPTGKTLKNKTAFVPFVVSLDRGETFQVQSNENLDGSTIRVLNDKKLIAYTGDRCSNFPSGACDHQVEQIFPDVLLDTVYYALPQFGHTNGYIVKIITIDTLLNVMVNGKAYTVPSKNQPLILDVPKEDSVLRISASRPFSCFQFLKGANSNAFTQSNGYIVKGWGDPAILQLLSNKFMGNTSTFSTVNSTNLKDHFVTILVPTAAKNSVYLDYSLISPSEFIEVADDKSLSYAKIKLTLGTHTISCSAGHLAYCYGIGNYESYFYAAGFSLPNFDIDIKDTSLYFDCKNNKVKMRFKAVLEGAIKSFYWDFGDGSPIDTAQTVEHIYEANKDFTVKLWAIGVNNKIDSVVRKYHFSWPEFNPVFDKLLCDPSFTYQETNPFFTNFKWHDNSTANSFTATKTEQVWVTATDTSGYCKFADTAHITKVDVLAKIFVDTLSNCYLNNAFKFVDSSGVKGDLIKSKVWTFPGGVNLYDTSNFTYHFKTAGNLKVYLDIYPANAECKARIEIPVKVNWNTDIDAALDKSRYCDGETVTLKDNSYACCQKVKKYHWQIEGLPEVTADSGLIKIKAAYDYFNKNGIRSFKYITETEQGCRDTLNSSMLVWPKADAAFDFGPDTTKCLAISRWTFTHTVNEDIAGPYSLYWDFGNGKNGDQSQYKNMRYFDTGTFAIKLVTTTAIGCLDSMTKQVKVIGNALTHFAIKDSTQCFAGNSFEVIDSSKGDKLNYYWDFGNGKTSNLPNPPKFSYDSAGIYKVSLKLVSENTSCLTDTVAHYAVVLRQPKADFNFNADTQCFDNHKVTITPTAQFYNGKKQLYWQYGQGIDSSDVPKTFSFLSKGAYQVTLTAIDTTNCIDTITKTVNIYPHPEITLKVNDSIQCFGQNKFVFDALTADEKIGYKWLFNKQVIDLDNQVELVNLTSSGKQFVTLVATNEFNCHDSSFIRFEVLPSFKALFKIDKDTQCFSSHLIQLNDISTPPKDAINSVQYVGDEGFIANSSTVDKYTFTSPGNKKITYVMVSENNCIDSSSQNLFLAEDPVVSFGSDSVCLGNAIAIKGVQNAGFPISTWQFKMGDGNTVNQQTFTYTYTKDGTFLPSLAVTDVLGCQAHIDGNPNVIYALPNADFNINILGNDAESAQLQLVPKQLGNSSYSYIFSQNNTYEGVSPIVNVPRFFKDSIYLKVISPNGCTNSSARFLDIFPPLNELYIANAFTPDNNGLNDVFRPANIDGVSDYLLKIYNRWGELLFTSDNPKQGWNGKYKEETVQAGVYIYTLHFIYSDGRLYQHKGNVTVLK